MIEQHDENGIGLFTRLLWSTMYDKGGALFCQYTSPQVKDAVGTSYVVFTHTNRNLPDMSSYYYDGDLSRYQCKEGESLYAFQVSSNFRHGDGMPGWGLIGIIGGACVTNHNTDAFGIKMTHVGGKVIDLTNFVTHRATGWAPGGDPWQGGGWGCTDIWVRTGKETKHCDLRGTAYGVPISFDLANMPDDPCELTFEYSS